MARDSVVQLLLKLCLLSVASANAEIPRNPLVQDVSPSGLSERLEVWRRATPEAPDGYTPTSVDCSSSRPALRHASNLSPEEVAWIQKRRSNTVQPLRDFLTRMNITGFDAGSYIDSNQHNASAIPNIGIAVSGGGYRSLMTGAGALAAFDSRTVNSTTSGHIGGLLQAATYLAGLSGGGWLVGSLYSNNFTSVQTILDTAPDQSGSLWQFGNSVLKGPASGKIQVLSTAEYYQNLIDTVSGKSDAGFDTSITDYWSRALSFQLVNASQGGPAFTWSSISDDPDFADANAPMPILVADGRAPGETVVSTNATVFEMNPWELGSWDPTLYGFAPMKFVGSNFSGGVLPQDQKCINGFDNVAFIMGTSSSLFNQFILNLNTTDGVPDALKNILAQVLTDLGADNDDIASWSPNPFFGWNNGSNPTAQSRGLTLVDGGEDLQNIPLYPLIQPSREVDVIFAVDSSADTLGIGANWPNGTALVATYERSLNQTMQNGTAFPSIPDQNTFVNLGLNSKPTFFGCAASNFTGRVPPLVVYVPNHPYIYNSNTSTFDLQYNNTERNVMIENGYLVATLGNATVDDRWPQCVGCAVMSRTWSKNDAKVPDVCNQCFQRYCWNGTRDSTIPPPFNPSSVFTQVSVRGTGNALVPSLFSLAFALGSALMLIF